MCPPSLAGSTGPCMSPCRHLSLSQCRYGSWMCWASPASPGPSSPRKLKWLGWVGLVLSWMSGLVLWGQAGGVRLGTSAALLEVIWVQLSSSSLGPGFEDSCQMWRGWNLHKGGGRERREGGGVEKWLLLDPRAHQWQSWNKKCLSIFSCLKPFPSPVVSENGNACIYTT